jgi:hypothetical protein
MGRLLHHRIPCVFENSIPDFARVFPIGRVLRGKQKRRRLLIIDRFRQRLDVRF